MIATKTLLLMVMGLAGRENGGKAKNCRVLRRVLARVLAYRWFSRYVIAATLVDGKQKIAHKIVLFIHQHLFISSFLFVFPETAWKPPLGILNKNSQKSR